ncbi:MAG: hypothetical protein K5752_05360 [Succinivibrionaceae bacterium]|nr:hypothetical protein [Succinivibrionaceae bacterium]
MPKVKYSSLTEREKLWMVYNHSYTVCEDFPCGQFAEWMNDQWYGILLRLLKDCGYDTSKVEHVNWKKIKRVVPYFSHFCSDAHDRLKGTESPEVHEKISILSRLSWIYSYSLRLKKY